MGQVVVGVLASLVLLLDVLGGFVLPSVAEGIIEDRLREEFTAEFGGVIGVDVQVGAPGPLLRGEIESVDIAVQQYAIEVDGVATIANVSLDLDDLVVDRARALDGTLDRVEVGAGSFALRLSTDTVIEVVLGALARERPDVAVNLLRADVGNLLFELELPGVGAVVVVAAPNLAGQGVGFSPVDVQASGPEADRAARDLVAELGVSLPELPYGLVFDTLSLNAQAVELTGDVPAQIDLAG